MHLIQFNCRFISGWIFDWSTGMNELIKIISEIKFQFQCGFQFENLFRKQSANWILKTRPGCWINYTSILILFHFNFISIHKIYCYNNMFMLISGSAINEMKPNSNQLNLICRNNLMIGIGWFHLIEPEIN